MSGPPDEIVAGDGHPDFSGWGLTADEEKQVDDKGRMVIRCAPWSQVPSGLWLVIYLKDHLGSAVDRPLYGHQNQYLGMSKWLCLGTTRGRPRVVSDRTLGACLELPTDLAQDLLKIRYVTEWVMHTIAEIGDKAGVSRSRLVKHSHEFVQMVDKAIMESGL